MQQDNAGDITATLDLPRPRYVTPITPNIRTAAVALVCMATLLVCSGLVNWFSVTILAFAPHTFAGFHFGLASAWFASVPVGWVLLGVALVLVCVAAMILRSRRAVWLFRAAVGCTLLSAAAFVLVLVERSHVHSQIPLDLRKSTLSLVANRPETKDQVEKELAALVINDRIGLWLALAAAAACAVIAAFIAVKSRRPREAPSA